MSRSTLSLLLAVLSLLLCGAGLRFDSWWVVAGGVVALAGAAWLVTEFREEDG
jgi:hypothetical protein